jgi:hypothetical protein
LLRACSGLACLVALGAASLSPVSALAAGPTPPTLPAPLPSPQPCVVSTAGQQVCTVQSGQQVLVIVLSNPANQAPSQLTNQPPAPLPPTTQVSEPDMSNVTDPRIDTYAKRQAIRDQYQGKIDVLTFNDELSDGVPLDQALSDAILALQQHPTSTPGR